MEWETPESMEISLACEISGYANAELSVSLSKEQGVKQEPSAIAYACREAQLPRRRDYAGRISMEHCSISG